MGIYIIYLFTLFISFCFQPKMTEEMLTCHIKNSTGLNNKKLQYDLVSGSWYCSSWFTITHYNLMGHLNRTEPSLMLLVTPILLLLWQVTMSAVKRPIICYGDRQWVMCNKACILESKQGCRSKIQPTHPLFLSLLDLLIEWRHDFSRRRGILKNRLFLLN